MGVISVSSKGQIVIPKDVRDKMDIKEGTKLLVEAKDGVMEVRPIEEASWKRWRGCLAGFDVLKDMEDEHKKEGEKDEEDLRCMGDPGMAEK